MHPMCGNHVSRITRWSSELLTAGAAFEKTAGRIAVTIMPAFDLISVRLYLSFAVFPEPCIAYDSYWVWVKFLYSFQVCVNQKLWLSGIQMDFFCRKRLLPFPSNTGLLLLLTPILLQLFFSLSSCILLIFPKFFFNSVCLLPFCLHVLSEITRRFSHFPFFWCPFLISLSRIISKSRQT